MKVIVKVTSTRWRGPFVGQLCSHLLAIWEVAVTPRWLRSGSSATEHGEKWLVWTGCLGLSAEMIAKVWKFPSTCTTWSTSGDCCCSWWQRQWSWRRLAPRAQAPAPADTRQWGAAQPGQGQVWPGCPSSPSTSISPPPPSPPSQAPACPPCLVSLHSPWQTLDSLQSCLEPSLR